MKKYLIGSAIALSLIVGVGAQSAQALTQAEANAIITALGLNAAQSAAIQALVTAPAAAPASVAFTRSLTVGSSGSDVTALQQWLVANGYLTMPAGVAYGYFGTLTRSAVAAYQRAQGITPAAGYFGPITIARISASTPVTPVTPGTPVTPVTPGTPVVGLDNTDGSATASPSSYVSSGQTIKKGETKDLIAVQLQATAGKVAVNRFDVHFNLRPWLYFGQLTLKDTSGNVVATKQLTGPADATEVTVGSDYLVRFDNVNYVVNPGPNQVLVVSGTVLASTDKVTTTQAVTITVPAGSIRTINGRGYTDSLGGSGALGSGYTITITATGSTGDVLARISPSTPSQRIVTTSTSQITSDVVLGVFSLKSQNNTSTANTLKFNINNNMSMDPTLFLSNVRLVDSATGAVYGASTITSGGVATFNNLTISLPQDTWKDLTVKADVAATTTSGIMASTSLAVNTTNVVGTDANFNTVTTSVNNTVVSNDVTFLTAGVSVSATSVSVGSPITGSQNGVAVTTGYPTTVNFTLTNTGNSDVFISKNPVIALATSTNYSGTTDGLTAANASSSITYVTPNPATLAGDTSASYVIPAGSSRSFQYTGRINKNGSTTGNRVMKVTAIYFGSSSTESTQGAAGTNASNSINFGLENLVFNVGF